MASSSSPKIRSLKNGRGVWGLEGRLGTQTQAQAQQWKTGVFRIIILQKGSLVGCSLYNFWRWKQVSLTIKRIYLSS